MAHELIYIPNEDTQDCPVYRLQLVVEAVGHTTTNNHQNSLMNQPTNQHSIKVPKVVKPTNKKTFL